MNGPPNFSLLLPSADSRRRVSFQVTLSSLSSAKVGATMAAVTTIAIVALLLYFNNIDLVTLTTVFFRF